MLFPVEFDPPRYAPRLRWPWLRPRRKEPPQPPATVSLEMHDARVSELLRANTALVEELRIERAKVRLLEVRVAWLLGRIQTDPMEV